MDHLFIINQTTGEVITTDVAFYRTKKQQQGWHEKRKRLMTRGTGQDRFVACFHGSMKEKQGELSFIEAGALLKLLFYLSIDQKGKLVKDKESIRLSYLKIIFGRSKSSTIALLKSLKQHGLIKIEREGRPYVFYINETYHHRGKLRSKFIKLAIGTYSLSHISVLDLAEAGFFYKLIPYLHYVTNQLVDNADEKDLEQLKTLNRNTIARLLDCDPKRVTVYMNRLHETGIIRKERTVKGLTYTVNRGILYRTYKYEEGFDTDRETDYETLGKG